MRTFAKAGRFRFSLLGHFLLALLPVAAVAQAPLEDAPKPYVPTRPLSQTERNRRQALYAYARGLLCERDDRLLEALKSFEEASRLDPHAPAPFKARAPILLALDRPRDAQAVLSKVHTLNPGDHEAWFLDARIHKALGEHAQACRCFERGLQTKGIVALPEIAQQIYLELGQLHETAQDWKEAIAAFQAAAKILDHPDLLTDHLPIPRDAVLARSAEIHERLGHLHRKLKQYDQALVEFKKAQAQNPERAGRLHLQLAQLCIEQAKDEQALHYLDAYLRLQPLGLEAYEMKIDLLRRLDRTDAIIPWLNQATRNDPNNVGLKLLLARQLAANHQHEKAEAIFAALADATPTPEIYKGLFQVYRSQPSGMEKTLRLINATIAKAQEKPGVAGQQARAMLAVVEEDADIGKALVDAGVRQLRLKNELSFETLQLLGVLADRQRRFPEAEEFFRRCLPLRTAENEALAYSGLLRVLWKMQNYDDVLDVCNQGLKSGQPANRVLFQNERARALTVLGKLDAALQAAEQAVDLANETDRLAVRRLKVRILIQAGKYDDAQAECDAMLKEFKLPGDILEVRYLLSSLYSAMEKHEKAEEQLQLILQADPDNATANNDLGYVWADRNKNLAEAETMIRRAIEVDRRQRKLARPGSGASSNAAEETLDNAAYLDSLGWVLFRRGQVHEALRELERAVKAEGGEDPVIFEHLGEVHLRLEHREQARAAWEKSLRLYRQEKHRKMEDKQRELVKKLEALQ